MQYDFLGFESGTSIVVTGAGSGIGKAVAITAARLGLSVGAWDLKQEAAESTVEEISKLGGTALAQGLDVGSETAVKTAWDTTLKAFGPVPYFVAAAGPPSFGTLEFMEGVTCAIDCMRVPTDAWLEACDISYRSAVYLSSVQGPRYGAGNPWYSVAKSAIDGYMRSLAAMRPGGIRSNAILPDWIYTPRTAQYVDSMGGTEWSDNPMGRLGVAQDVANTAIFLISPAAEYLNGLSVEVDGGAKLKSMAFMRMSAASNS